MVMADQFSGDMSRAQDNLKMFKGNVAEYDKAIKSGESTAKVS